MHHDLAYPALVTSLALLVYLWNFAACGQARAKHKIKAPAVTGHPDFERKLRVQQNMIEQLIAFIPALWVFSLTLSSTFAALLGLLFVVGRVLYSQAYYRDPEKRGIGFMLSALPTLVLIVGGFVGSVLLAL